LNNGVVRKQASPKSVLQESTLDLRVKECERKPDIFGGTIADAFGRPHKWLAVEGRRSDAEALNWEIVS
jgi:hypothetical protein